MADRYTSRIALLLERPVDDVGPVVAAAIAAGDIDRSAPLQGGREAHEVHWGGRMQKAVVRALDDEGRHLLRVEAFVGGEGIANGMTRQALLLRALARVLREQVRGVWDESCRLDRDLAWVNRLAVGSVERADAVVTVAEGEGTWWVRTHGAARFDVPDLELYGLAKAQVGAGEALLQHVVGELLAKGLKGDLALAGGAPIYLIPVLEAWQHLPLEWPGIGRAGENRGPGLDGPRATVSLLHKPRLGRYRKDFAGVLDTLAAT